MKNLSWDKKILFWLGVVAFVTNPLTAEVVLQAVDWAYAQAIAYNGYAMVAFLVYLIGWFLIMNHRAEKPKLPSKSKKTKTQAYITT